MSFYGRTQSAWDQLENAGLAFLIERARLQKDTRIPSSARSSKGARDFLDSISRRRASEQPWAIYLALSWLRTNLRRIL